MNEHTNPPRLFAIPIQLHPDFPELGELEKGIKTYLGSYPTEINVLADVVHRANAKWWQNIDTGEPIERNRYELLALVISELSECLEGERKGLMDDKLPHRKMAEVELADAKIRLLDFAAGFGIEIESVHIPQDVRTNKGEALFNLMSAVVFIETAKKREQGFNIGYILSGIHAYAKKHGYDIDGAFAEKMAYNFTREDHTHEARRIAGGKQF